MDESTLDCSSLVGEAQENINCHQFGSYYCHTICDRVRSFQIVSNLFSLQYAHILMSISIWNFVTLEKYTLMQSLEQIWIFKIWSELKIQIEKSFLKCKSSAGKSLNSFRWIKFQLICKTWKNWFKFLTAFFKFKFLWTSCKS